MNENKAEDIKILNLKKINNSVTDYFVLCTGKSTTQIGAIADIIEKKVSKKFNEKPWKKEGKIIDTKGNILGKHDGIFYYTIGQRKGINIGGTGPWYVVHKNLKDIQRKAMEKRRKNK